MSDPHLTYPEVIVVGLLQGVTELFPISSLGHSVLVPALIGGRWASDLNLTADKSPYLTFLVAVHVATAIALVVFFRRDWARVIVGLATSLRDRTIATPDQRLAWLLVVATIPVGLAGVALDHAVRSSLGKPVPASIFLILNGVVLAVAERLRRRTNPRQDQRSDDDAGHADNLHGHENDGSEAPDIAWYLYRERMRGRAENLGKYVFDEQ